LLLNRFGADPAISSSIFTTMVTDVIGFLAFLSLAAWWLHLGYGRYPLPASLR
jgi:magnesium transporter